MLVNASQSARKTHPDVARFKLWLDFAAAEARCFLAAFAGLEQVHRNGANVAPIVDFVQSVGAAAEHANHPVRGWRVEDGTFVEVQLLVFETSDDEGAGSRT